MKEHFVAKQSILNQGSILRLWYQDGSVRDIDLKMLAKRGGVFQKLLNPEYVKRMKPTSDGAILEFPDGETWSAQVCWLEGVPVKAEAPRIAKPLFANGKAASPGKTPAKAR